MNLDLIPTEDILEELEKRFEHMIFYGLKEGVGSIGKNRSEGTYRYAGVLDTAVGLCVRLEHLIVGEMYD